jgi:hypothetical protein
MRAAVITPVRSPPAFLARFRDDFGLPRYYGESALTLAFSGPARRLLTLPPAWTTGLLKEAFSRSASGHSSPLDPPRVFPAGARVCRPGFSPGRKVCLCKAHAITLAENSMRPVALGRKNWIHIRQSTGRPQGCGDPFGRGKLSAVNIAGYPRPPTIVADNLMAFFRYHCVHGQG